MSIGTYTPDTVTMGNVPSSVPNQNADPGSVNPPAVAEPTSAFTGGTAVLIIAASGASATYGGCEVHLSFDGTNYSKIGTIESQAPQGVLTANLADHADPDTVNTLAVDCTESFTPPPAGITHADADADRTLSLVCAQPSAGVLAANGEFISFGAVAATGTYAANLTYLRRGRMGSAHAAHSSGDMFTVLDVLGQTTGSLRYELPAQYIGATLYLKLAAFNQFGNSTQDLSLVTEYTYVPNGTGYGGGSGGVPATPTGLATTPGVQQVQLSWSANPATDNVTAYKVFRAAGTGASFGSAVLIATVNALAYLDPALGIATGYTYFLEAVNAVGASSPTSGVNATTSSTAIGTVTSVALAAPTEFTVSGSPVTGAGTLTFSKNTQAANLVYAGPTTGSAAVPIFRSLVAADLPLATSSAFGAVKPDNSTITISAGVISAAGGGSVSIAAGTGILCTPSPITGTGTVGLASIADGDVLANTSGSSAAPVPTTLSALIDHAIGSSPGDILYRDSSAWKVLAPGTTGQFLETQGAGANPQWATPAGGGGGGAGAWWNLVYPPGGSAFASSNASQGNLVTPQQNITLFQISVFLTTVNSATYKVGIAPFNTGTAKITSAPTYGAAVTIGSSAGAVNQWISASFSGAFAMTAGTTYVVFIVRTDATSTTSMSINTTLSGPAVYSPGFLPAGSTNSTARLASLGPTTSDVWTVSGGDLVTDLSYQFT
jgi:hypothetical protein